MSSKSTKKQQVKKNQDPGKKGDRKERNSKNKNETENVLPNQQPQATTLKEQVEKDHVQILIIEEQKDGQLTQNRIQLIQTSWEDVKFTGIETVGMLLFKNIFTNAPELLELFSFKDLNDVIDLYNSPQMKNHASLVISTLELAIDGLTDLGSLSKKLKNLGKSHIKFGVQLEHYQIFGQSLLQTLEVVLGEGFTPDIRYAYEVAYQIIAENMISGGQYYQPENDQQINNIQKMEPDKEMPTIQGTIGDDSANINDIYKATTEKQFHNQKELNELEMELMNQENADKYTNFEHQENKGNENDLILQNPRNMKKEREHFNLAQSFEINEMKFDPSDDFQEIDDLKHLENDKQQNDDNIYQVELNINEEKHKADDCDNDSECIRSDCTRPLQRKKKINKLLSGMAEYYENKKDDKERKYKKHNDSQQSEQGYDDKVRKEYLAKFRQEVDFHHKVAYRYEKAYRLGKKQPYRKSALNFEIIDIISEHSDYIDQDPLALFYCLYFCIYYNNPELVEFLRTLIQKMDYEKKSDKIVKLLDYIDNNRLERIRATGEQINSIVYHMVYYQAVDDELRVVYSQILRQLRIIQIRDKDALILLKNRDYDLIKLTFDKYTTKINLKLFFNNSFSIKSRKYRKYNQAYYEEILIDNNVDQRIAYNYRERFLITAEDKFMALEMYSKNDYVNHFLRLDLSQITHQQFIELFIFAVKNDAFKIAMQIYLRYLSTSKIDQKLMDIIIETLKSSNKYHEQKLFYIHQHFNILTIAQMNHLIDTFMEILNRGNYKMNPMLFQYNCIKYAILIYRISWKIEEKRIYSLITKCTLLNNYINEGLCNYFEKLHHISLLYQLMREPIFHLSERKDSLDIMLEMKMEKLLQHPVIIEVVNLAYEGKFSVESSALSLSSTFQAYFLMDTYDLKSINNRLIQNITTFGGSNSGKQASLQFNIWKQCIEQRGLDEMLFTVIISIFFIAIIFYFDHVYSIIVIDTVNVFGEQSFADKIIDYDHFLTDTTPEQLDQFCPLCMDGFLKLANIIQTLNYIILFSGIGYFTAIVQKFVILKLKDNVYLSYGRLLLEIALVVVSILYSVTLNQKPSNDTLTSVCKDHSSTSFSDRVQIKHVYGLISSEEELLNFKFLLSILIMIYTLIMIMMLQRTQKLGEMILMADQNFRELGKFVITFGIVISSFIIVGRQLNAEFKVQKSSYLVIILNIFDGLNGNQNFDDYTFPQGKIFITMFVYIYYIILLSFLIAMFINRQQFVQKNLAALRRMNIIKLKNSSSFDPLFSGITITFFPINIMILPFIIPIIFFKSERLNDFILKVQYSFMIMMYIMIAIIFSIPLFPIMYGKCLFNEIYIFMNSKRQAYKGQNTINIIFTALLNPFIMLLSLFVDLLCLTGLLLKYEKTFEFKYPESLLSFNQEQTNIVTKLFTRMFYMDFAKNYSGRVMTVMDSMIMHRRVFGIIDNLHDLCCRGVKDSDQALANVQDYNMTKILSRKCAIPVKSGSIKAAMIDFNMLYSIQMDLEIYNYIDTVFMDYRAGKLNEKNDKKNDKGDSGLYAGVSFLSMAMAPSGYTFKRNNADFMNNFFIQIVARSFTDIEAQIENQKANTEMSKYDNDGILNELGDAKEIWKLVMVNGANEQYDKLGNLFRNQEEHYDSEKTKKYKDYNSQVSQET